MRRTLLLATSNSGKSAEFQSLIGNGVRILSLIDVDVTMPEETGETFRDNAEAKATSAAMQSGMFALADDSGLMVDALHGNPGVRSARFAGPHATDAENRAKLLREMEKVPAADRSARFVCAVALATPNGTVCTEMGVLEGTIGTRERGTSGFGYDRLFELSDGRTLAELSVAAKNALSHRAQAMHKMRPIIERMVRNADQADKADWSGAVRS